MVPERYRVLSGSVLKLLAIVTMLIDHVSKRILVLYPSCTTPLFRIGSTDVTWLVVCESIGRLAFPIFTFLLVEGFVHTRDHVRYGRNLLLFALVSEVPFDLSRKLMPLDPTYQNVFFTLFLSYLALCAYEAFRNRPALRAVCVLGLAFLALRCCPWVLPAIMGRAGSDSFLPSTCCAQTRWPTRLLAAAY